MITSRQLTRMGVRHYVIVEPSEVDVYTKACRDLLAEGLPLDMSYKGAYDTLDDLGETMGTGQVRRVALHQLIIIRDFSAEANCGQPRWNIGDIVPP